MKVVAFKQLIMKLSVHQKPMSALKRILENYDYIEYDEAGSSGINKLHVKWETITLSMRIRNAINSGLPIHIF